MHFAIFLQLSDYLPILCWICCSLFDFFPNKVIFSQFYYALLLDGFIFRFVILLCSFFLLIFTASTIGFVQNEEYGFVNFSFLSDSVLLIIVVWTILITRNVFSNIFKVSRFYCLLILILSFRLKRKLNHYWSCVCYRIAARALSIVARFHNRLAVETSQLGLISEMNI